MSHLLVATDAVTPAKRVLQVALKDVEVLKPNPGNARTHSKHQIRQIAASMREFGFTNPVLIDRSDGIIAGHGRVEAARLLGLQQVPTICLEDLTEDQVRAYILADNRLAEKAGWDNDILAIELQYLVLQDGILDVTITGFEVPEIDLILEEAGEARDEDDELPPVTSGPTVTLPGDLWLLGPHRLLCGNALEKSAFTILMEGKRAGMVHVDPPFNVAIAGNVSGKGAVKHGDFAMAAGEMDSAEFEKFLKISLGLLAQHSLPGSIHYIAMDWRHLAELLAAGHEVYGPLLNLCVWAKDRGGQGSFYRSQHELYFVFRNGKGPRRNNVMLGKFGRNRTNLWSYPSAATFSKNGEEGNLLALHPTVKPVVLIADAILDCTARGEIVLDSFLGSGSTLIASERTGRVCHAIEIDPKYVDVAVRRWQRYTGEKAIQAATRKTFDQRAEEGEVADAG